MNSLTWQLERIEKLAAEGDPAEVPALDELRAAPRAFRAWSGRPCTWRDRLIDEAAGAALLRIGSLVMLCGFELDAIAGEKHRPVDANADRARVAELEAKIERAVELAIETGGIAAAKRKLAALEQERAGLADRVELGAPRVPSADELRPLIEARVPEMRDALASDPRYARAAFGALLGGRRMVVYPDAEHGFRVEGLFRLALESESARRLHAADGRLDSGGRSVQISRGCPFRSRCPWRQPLEPQPRDYHRPECPRIRTPLPRPPRPRRSEAPDPHPRRRRPRAGPLRRSRRDARRGRQRGRARDPGRRLARRLAARVAPGRRLRARVSHAAQRPRRDRDRRGRGAWVAARER